MMKWQTLEILGENFATSNRQAYVSPKTHHLGGERGGGFSGRAGRKAWRWGLKS